MAQDPVKYSVQITYKVSSDKKSSKTYSGINGPDVTQAFGASFATRINNLFDGMYQLSSYEPLTKMLTVKAEVEDD